MGFFSKLTEKKFCAICGEQIKFMGNVKLEDGTLCKACSGKLSPWFTGRRRSTVEDIREQLAYREENKAAVAAFHTTRSLGNGVRLLLDEDAGKFVVTRARDLEEANPDVLDFSQVTGVDVDVRESRSEEKHRDKENHLVSYVPPRYTVSYRFEVTIRVNHPYFDEISFPLTPSDVTTTPEPVIAARIPDPATVREYRECGRRARRSGRSSPGPGSRSGTRPGQPPCPRPPGPVPGAAQLPSRTPAAAANTAAAP